jgi:shikimate dehydrogenase
MSSAGVTPAEAAGEPVRWAAVLGAPISHSLSPILHRAAYAALNLPWTYTARWCDAAALPAEVAAAVADPAWAGFSLTMPLKLAILSLLDEIEPLAAAVGAVNTALPGPAGLRGLNTDVTGMVTALREAGCGSLGPASSCVLGAGGTAAAALAALADLGDRAPTVLVREPARAGALLAAAERLGVTVDLQRWSAGVPAGTGLIVSTVPAGAAELALPQRNTAGSGTVFDVVYDPWPTLLAESAQRAGWAILGGRELLLQQARGQIRAMTGSDIPADVLRAAMPAS